MGAEKSRITPAQRGVDPNAYTNEELRKELKDVAEYNRNAELKREEIKEQEKKIAEDNTIRGALRGLGEGVGSVVEGAGKGVGEGLSAISSGLSTPLLLVGAALIALLALK